MLSNLNKEAYAIRPDLLKDMALEAGIWFYPGEDAHLLMRAVSAPSERLVRDATTALDSVSVTLGAPEDDEREVETLIEVTLSMPTKVVTGKLNLKIVASTSAEDAIIPFITLFDEEISTLSELEEALENVNPAVVALTW